MPILKFTQEEANEIILNALCDGASYIQGYSCHIDASQNDYNDAREKIGNPSIEDVFMQVLKDGKPLIWLEHETLEEKSITLDVMTKRLNDVPFDVITNFVEEQYDALDADVVLQTIFLGEVVYG